MINRTVFFGAYDVVNYGKRSVKTRKNELEFTHELSGADGYAYSYTKVVKLTKGKPELVLEHRLKKHGSKGH